jgi:glutamine synthetase
VSKTSVATLPTLDQLYEDPDRRARIEEIEGQLVAEGVTHVYFQYVTLQGRVIAKLMPTQFWVRSASRGLSMPYCIAGGLQVNLAGQLLGEDGNTGREGAMLPDLDTFAILPWDRRFARVFCGQYRKLQDEEAPGQPAAHDCRQQLKRAFRELAEEMQVEPVSGCEPEMSWFRDAESIDASASQLPPFVSTAYHARHAEDMRPVLSKVTEYCKALGFNMIQATYEDPAQIEINFEQDNFLSTADRLVTYRQVCIQVAQELGMFATFMPKPVPGIMANGCHHHVSFMRDGENILIDNEATTRRNLTEVGLQAVGGILTHLRGMMAVLAPTVNSYKRYLEQDPTAASTGLTPTDTNWGYDNRLCAVRALPGRFEVRAPDASTNPYLSHLALLAAVEDGWKRQVDPGVPLEDEVEQSNTNGAAAARFAPLPITLGEALDAFEADDVVTSFLGSEMSKLFVECKRDEWNRYCGAITDWDYETYLNYIP